MFPWQLKLLAKIVLSRIPLPYQRWRRIGLFEHGQMTQPDYAFRVFKKHFDRVEFGRKHSGFACLELGPGDTLFSALIAASHGAGSSWLVDNGSYASLDHKLYALMEEYIRDIGMNVPAVNFTESPLEWLTSINCHYEVDGLQSLRSMETGSVDYIWSHAVLEHIRRDEFLEFFKQLRRVIRDEGVSSHRVDLTDHLGGALNNLRFSRRVWESGFMSSSGFYTNRIRYSEMLGVFKEAGFDAEVVQRDSWDKLPTPREQMSPEFQYSEEAELRVFGFDVILRPRRN